MPIPAWRAAQTTSTTGTGTIVLNAAPTTRRSFQAAFGAGSIRIGYVIQGTTFWEVGLGDFDGASPGNLTRVTVLASSNSNALVSLPAGTADVFAFLDPASRALVTGTGTLTLALADIGNLVSWSGTTAQTANLPAIATVPPGNGFLIVNSGTAALTIDPNAAEQINGAATLVVNAGGSANCYRVGSAWVAAVSLPAAAAPAEVPTGAMLDFGGAGAAPSGYLLADGSLRSRTTFAALFAVFGSTWGVGDGSTTFGTPDSRRRVAVGSGGTGTGTLGAAVGNTGGAETHALATAELAAHAHTGIGTLKGTDGIAGNSSINIVNTSSTVGGDTSFSVYISTVSAGSGTSHNNMQPSYIVQKIIKT